MYVPDIFFFPFFLEQRLKHENIVAVGDTAYSIEYRQQFYTAFTVESVKTDLQQLIEVCDVCFFLLTRSVIE
jgi:hypothetical protein